MQEVELELELLELELELLELADEGVVEPALEAFFEV